MRAFLAAFLFLSTLLAGQQKPDPTHDQLILTNVNVVDTRTGQVGHNLTVVLKNGRIDSLAKVALIGSGHDLRVVNGNGKYLIPGLWDMHVHTAGGSAKPWDERIVYPLQIANGITGVRDMGGDVELLKQRRERIAKGELLGPHMLLAGPFLTRGKSDEQSIGVNNPVDARQAVDSVKKQGLDFVKILSVSYESYQAIVEESRKQHISFVGHVPGAVSVAEASAEGQRSIEHLSGFLMACSSKEKELRQQQQQAREKQDGSAIMPPKCRRWPPTTPTRQLGFSSNWWTTAPGRCLLWCGIRPTRTSTIRVSPAIPASSMFPPACGHSGIPKLCYRTLRRSVWRI